MNIAQPSPARSQLGIFMRIVLPLTFLSAYMAGMFFAPQPSEFVYKLVFPENGIVELGTAAFFLTACVVAVVLACKRGIPGKCRVLYLLFALAALFVCLEEINYGQFLLKFDTPEWFDEHSSKGEFNLHNLYGNMPARRMNSLATFGFPLFFILLPLLGRKRPGWYRPGHWSFWILPRLELWLYVVIAQGLTWLDDLCRWLEATPTPWERATEFKEFYWGLSAMLFTIIMWRRLRQMVLSVGIVAAPETARVVKPESPAVSD